MCDIYEAYLSAYAHTGRCILSIITFFNAFRRVILQQINLLYILEICSVSVAIYEGCHFKNIFLFKDSVCTARKAGHFTL